MNFNHHKILIHFFQKKTYKPDDLGLLNGKIGICLYFFYLYGCSGDQQYHDHAKKLLQEVINGISTTKLAIGFEHGLAGIGWAIEHLCQQELVDSNYSKSLDEIDNQVFTTLQVDQNIKKLPLGLENGLLGYGYYLISRLHGIKNRENKNDTTLRRLLIDIINQIHVMIDSDQQQLTEPLAFNSFWSTPHVLFFFGQVKEMGFYDKKVLLALDSLFSHQAIPKLHSNRLLLLLGWYAMQEANESKILQNQINQMEESIDTSQLKHEFSDLMINSKDGLSGLLLLSKVFPYGRINDEKFRDSLKNQIEHSSLWSKITPQKDLSKNSFKLFDGLAGLGIALLNWELQ